MVATFLAAAAMLQAGDTTPHSSVSILPGQSGIYAGKPFLVGVRVEMEPDWHIYWKNPGDSGMPTSIEWNLPKGWTAGDIIWPAPKKLESAGEVTYGYEKAVTLLTWITPPKNLAPGRQNNLKAKVSYLICHDTCLPGAQSLAITLPSVAANAPIKVNSPLLEVKHQVPPRVAGPAAKFWVEGDNIILETTNISMIMGNPPTGYFFVDAPEVIDHSKPQTSVYLEPNRLRTTMKKSPYARTLPKKLSGILQVEMGSGSKSFYNVEALPAKIR